VIRAALYSLERFWVGELAQVAAGGVDCGRLQVLGPARRGWGCRRARAVGGVFSHRGPRSNNEDAGLVAIAPGHFAAVAVADGVGGLRAGEVASFRAMCVVLRSLAEAARRLGVFSREWFVDLFNRAHNEVAGGAGDGATTLSVAVYDLNAHVLHVASAGDSVVYMSPDVWSGGCGSAVGYRLVTPDLDESSNAEGRFITQAVGHKSYREPHYYQYPLGGCEDTVKIVFAATDGVDDFIDRSLYGGLVGRFRRCRSAEGLAKMLVCSALRRGGRDNATAAVLAILPVET
jgi:serine/threonine protein phosphatase PrpC